MIGRPRAKGAKLDRLLPSVLKHEIAREYCKRLWEIGGMVDILEARETATKN
jgi:hypothetical protein